MTARGARWLCALAGGLASIALARPGIAAPTEVESALATALFKEAKALMNEGRWAEACLKLSESQRLDPGGGTLLNLALCREKEGKLATAWAHYNEALAIAEQQKREDRVAFARSHLQDLEPKLPRVIVIVRSPAPDQELTLDGAVLRQPAWGARVPLDPGAHVVNANARGRTSYSVTFTLRAEQTLDVVVPELEHEHAPAPQPVVKAPVRSARIDRAPPSSLRPWAYVSLGLGAAGLGTGAIAGLAALQKQSHLDDSCAEPAHCPAEQRGNIDAMNRYAGISTVAFAVGASAAAAGALLLIFDDPVRVSIGARGAVVSSRF